MTLSTSDKNYGPPTEFDVPKALINKINWQVKKLKPKLIRKDIVDRIKGFLKELEKYEVL